ncbi:MAG: sensor histidine kinase [Pseudonocardiaceae bacterium]
MSGLMVQSLRVGSARGIRELALVGMLAVGFVFGTQAAAARQQLIRHELDALGYALLVTTACALAGRTRWPRSTLAAVLVLVGSYLLIGYPYSPVLWAVSVAVFAVVDRSSMRQATWATLIALVALALSQLPAIDAGSPLGDAAVLLAVSAALVVPPALLAMIRQWRRQARAAEQRQALVEERLMLAREVHDVVAHNLSMVSIQAGAALRVFDQDPRQAKQALALIHRTNQESLADLRRTLDVLRRPCEAGQDSAATRPAPGLAQLGALIETVRAAGITAELIIEGAPTLVPPLIELTIYRIVQESLTNVVRHAEATHTTVRIQHAATSITVEISDDGTGRPARDASGAGLVGMRERAEAAGGRLTWGSSPGSGFQVNARLPHP